MKFAIEPLYSDVNVAINSKSMRRLRTSAVIFLVMFCATAEIDCAARSAKQLGTVLTGKFVARVDGPPVTGFGMNRESYVFEMFSPTGSQFVTLSNTFLIYQPHLPVWGLDYSKLYKLTAVRDATCDDTLENISRRAVLLRMVSSWKRTFACLRPELPFYHATLEEPLALLRCRSRAAPRKDID